MRKWFEKFVLRLRAMLSSTLTLEQCGFSGSTPWAVKNPHASAITASKTKELISDSPKGRQVGRFGHSGLKPQLFCFHIL